ncbi:lactonase family protein [Mumia sp. zg.B53]|nr:lactonase family protein [Mumia sp. zg.B53]
MTTMLALIGCSTTDGEPGIRSARVHADGAIEPCGALAMESPSCVVWHPRLPVAYATNETLAGGITAVTVAESGAMEVIGTAPTGATPCHAAVTRDGRWLLTADYLGGTVSLVALAPDGRPQATVDRVQMTGSGPHPERQDAPHPHMVAVDVAGENVLCVDLGTDRLTSLAITRDGRLERRHAWVLPPGTGPRQVVSHPGRAGVLVIGELSATLLHLNLEKRGDSDGVADETVAEVISEVRTTASHETTYPAQIATTGEGAHVVVSNRGPDSLAVFDTGSASLVRVAETPAGVSWPRHFAVVGGYVLVVGERSAAIASYEFGVAGQLGAPTGRLATPAPTWIAVRPA